MHKKAFGGLLFLLLVMAALLFIPAWTQDYWQAWTFLAVYFASSLAITFYLRIPAVSPDPAGLVALPGSRGTCREGALARPRQRSLRGDLNSTLKLNTPY